MAYAGYAVLSDLMYLSNAPAPSSSVPQDPQLVAPLERPLKCSGGVKCTLVSRSALQAAQSAYLSAIQSASTYHLYFRNSNYYVNSVLIGAGANPRVPGAWTPAFTF